MKICQRFLLITMVCLGAFPFSADAADEAATARQILDTAGVRGGFIVHLGCGDGALTAALKANESYQVQGLAHDGEQLQTARKNIRGVTNYGPVAADRLSGPRLPYVNNLVNLIVASDAGEVSKDEMLRVLAPRGVLLTQQGDDWVKTVKPVPAEIDDWSHYLQDATGNAVAEDTVVGPPRHLQWIGSPRWSRHHDRMASMSAMTTQGGRMFYIMDEGSRISIQLPADWKLIARDAFNGVVLWKRDIPKWQSHLWPLKSGPTHLARRLVSIDGMVYTTLGIEAPLSQLDGATGKTIREFEGSEKTEEVIVSAGTAVALVRIGKGELDDYVPKFGTVGDQGDVRRFVWNEEPRFVKAYDVESGKLLWSQKTKVAPLTLTSDGQRVFFHDGSKLVVVDQRSGEQQWASKPVDRRQAITFNFGPKLVVHENIVLFAGGDRTMTAYDTKSGKVLWSAPHARGGYQSPEDLLVQRGLVWSAPLTSGRDSGMWTGRDVKTGEVKVEFPPNVETYWFHHRCHISKATSKYLIPSRTGIEFVDPDDQDWMIHHWVRGGCLYGMLPANGLVYAPPHNCACYPEAKLYGMNALAPVESRTPLPEKVSDAGRLEKGEAYNQIRNPKPESGNGQWPTFRGDMARSGFSPNEVAADVSSQWQTKFDGRLSAPTIADGVLYVAEIDAHTVHALDAKSGESLWSFTTGGRVDSPPTISNGLVLFGSTDGYVYCLSATDGQLAWRFRAAPRDERLMSMEQLESVWPVNGSVLVENDRESGEPAVTFVAGRSYFLDGGLRMIRLEVKTGKKLAEKILDDRDPETGKNLQTRIKTLQMPVGLPDILSSDGKYTYMRSQPFEPGTGERIEVGPHSGDFASQGNVQAGPTAHLFSPTGYLDDSYFHRSYWVWGRSFAGGHGGYYQAGKYAPGGRLMVADDDNVYAFGRKPEYLKWTTVLEHQLFAASKAPTSAARDGSEDAQAIRRGTNKKPAALAPGMIHFELADTLDPTGKALCVEAWVKTAKAGGVVVAHGGPANGYALVLEKGKPQFLVRSGNELGTATGKAKLTTRWTHLAGVLTADKELQVYVNGELAGEGKAPNLIAAAPLQSLQIGGDDGTGVGEYKSPFVFTGTIDDVRIFHGPVKPAEVAAHAAKADAKATTAAKLVLDCSFNDREAKDASGLGHDGKLAVIEPAEGKFGLGMNFPGTKQYKTNRSGGSYVEHKWRQDIPLMVRAMVGAGNNVFVLGPPDLIDEADTFQRIANRDERVNALLTKQDEAFNGELGGVLMVVDKISGEVLAKTEVDYLPTWDGLAAAGGRLYVTTTDGRVVCLGK